MLMNQFLLKYTEVKLHNCVVRTYVKKHVLKIKILVNIFILFYRFNKILVFKNIFTSNLSCIDLNIFVYQWWFKKQYYLYIDTHMSTYVHTNIYIYAYKKYVCVSVCTYRWRFVLNMLFIKKIYINRNIYYTCKFINKKYDTIKTY